MHSELPSVRTELIARALSVEQLLISTWRECFSPKDSLALIAVGGFGRAELFLHSDVDLLLLTPKALKPELAARITQFQALAWQLKLDLAISVRSVEASVSFAAEDVSFMTSLLDLRLLCGNATLAERLMTQLTKAAIWAPEDFFAAKLSEQSARHLRFADTAYNNEPNIKDGPGGLRDLHTIRWIAQRCFAQGRAAPGWELLEQHQFISANERLALEHAEALLSSVRQALHFSAKRKEERLLFDHQIALAEHFGFVDIDLSNRAVEQLMQRYFRTVGVVIRLNTMLLARFAQRFVQGDDDAEVELAQGLRLRYGLLDIGPNSPKFTLSFALQVLQLWQITPSASGVGANYLEALSALLSEEKNDEEIALALPDLMALLDANSRVSEALAIAARYGLLGYLIPAFARVTGRMQYDLFHAYTVDQHTLFVLAKLEGLRGDNAKTETPTTLEVWARIRKPRLLFLAALFHDIAKGRGGDHSVLGADDVREFAQRVQMNHSDTELVAWLVHEHLTMSTTAQKRDIQDPAVVRQFALLVADRERLDHLYLLTIADIRGTNPKLWTGWKAKLLEDLYASTRFILRGGLELPVHAEQRTQAKRSETLELLRGEGAGYTQIHAIWQDFPTLAFLRHTAEELRFQTQAVLASQRFQNPDVIVLRVIPWSEALELFVRIKDRAGIFATIAAVLDRLNFSVVGARIGLSPSGMTHDTFQLHDLRANDQIVPRERASEAQMALTLALNEPVLKPKISKRVATRQQRHFQFPAQIECVASEDGTHTVLSLSCPDRFSLLANVSLSFFEHRLRVHSARIATFGERVEDFFTLSTEQNLALSPEQESSLAVSIREKLSAL